VFVQRILKEEVPNLGSGQHVIFQSYAVVVRVYLKVSMEGIIVSNKL
jgi:hypothetical protein